MFCAKCETEVSIADRHCPKCGTDLLKFGATKSSLPQTRKGAYANGIKGLRKEVFREIRDEIEISRNMESPDPMEASMLKPMYSNLLNVLNKRYASDEEIESAFNDRIFPEMVRLSQHEDALKFLLKIEQIIQSRLEENIYRHYEDNGNDVLKILRSGEINVKLINLLYQADLSVILFPFFKSAEVACRFHTRRCYSNLKNHRKLKEIADWLSSSADNLHIYNLPDWLENGYRKSRIIEIVKGLLTENEIHTAGSLATGIALYMFGRTWELKIRRVDLGEAKTFPIDNLLATRGKDEEKEALADKLQKLQFLRNKRVHERVEENHGIVDEVRDLSYECLNALPVIFRI